MHLIRHVLAAVLLLSSHCAFSVSDGPSEGPAVKDVDSVEAAVSHRKAQALSDEEIQARMAKSDLIALLSITHINSLVSPGLSMPGMLAVQGYEYHGRLEQQWKAAPVQTLQVRVDLSDCSERLQKGERYLVLSRLNLEAQFQSFRCDDLIHQSQASERIAQINQLSKIQLAVK